MRKTSAKSPVIDVSIVHYPESDGRPMGETDLHRDAMIRHIELLRHYYEGQQVYVSGDLLVYYEQGNPKKFVVPDAFVVKGEPANLVSAILRLAGEGMPQPYTPAQIQEFVDLSARQLELAREHSARAAEHVEFVRQGKPPSRVAQRRKSA